MVTRSATLRESPWAATASCGCARQGPSPDRASEQVPYKGPVVTGFQAFSVVTEKSLSRQTCLGSMSQQRFSSRDRVC